MSARGVRSALRCPGRKVATVNLTVSGGVQVIAATRDKGRFHDSEKARRIPHRIEEPWLGSAVPEMYVDSAQSGNCRCSSTDCGFEDVAGDSCFTVLSVGSRPSQSSFCLRDSRGVHLSFFGASFSTRHGSSYW